MDKDVFKESCLLKRGKCCQMTWNCTLFFVLKLAKKVKTKKKIIEANVSNSCTSGANFNSNIEYKLL